VSPNALCSLICSQPCEFIGLISDRRHLPIHTLNDDVLLNIFDLYRLADLGKYDDGTETAIIWPDQRWWYKLAHVCRQWRNIILESPSQLDLHLFCTNGVPVADMLAHSPPLPLTIYYTDRKITAEDESGILLALSHRDRVRHIHFSMFPNVGTFVAVMDDQLPNLERMYIHSQTEVVLPITFQAPNLRHLRLKTAFLPIRSPLLTATAGLVTLELLNIPESAYLPPSHILSRFSFMLQLEKLILAYKLRTNHHYERQPHQTLDMITLPNLRWFAFIGVSAYLEGLVARISAPSLSTFRVYLFPCLPFTFPHLLQFMQSSENLRFTALQVTFSAFAVSLHAVPWTRKRHTPLMLQIRCNLQVASAVQLFSTLSPVLSVVEQVAFSYQDHFGSSERRTGNGVARSQWRELLRPFVNAKTIRVQGDLISKIFRSLPSDDGEPPLELLPHLEEVGYSGGDSRDSDAFTRFLNERKVAGHPVSLCLVDPSVFDELPALNV
jgi:hypothetical protein